ncbi:MAG TPA: hypothetical protein VGM22_22870 [Methylomirabilota bacterium]
MFLRLSFVRLARALLSSPIGMASEEVGHTLRGVYVLLVDDNPRHRDVLREILQYCGAWVREALSAQEAVSLLRETTPTALVVAVRPPAAPAWMLVRSVRSMRPEHGGKMPIVGVGPAELAVQARAEGFDAYLSEPIEAWNLCRTVSELTE